MRSALVVTGVLGVGTALVFGAAGLTATLFPNGTRVAGGWNGAIMERDLIIQRNLVVGNGGWDPDPAMPMPAPDINVVPGGGGAWEDNSLQGPGSLPGDIVVEAEPAY